MEEGPDGVTWYAKERANHRRAGELDRFFLKSRPKVHHPAVKKWHSRIILQAKSRNMDEGKAVESTLRFLESAVFRKDSGRCDAKTVKNQLQSTWEQYREAQEDRHQTGTSRVNRLLQLPRTVIRRVVTRGKERETQEEVNSQLEEQSLWLDQLSPIYLGLDEQED